MTWHFMKIEMYVVGDSRARKRISRMYLLFVLYVS